MDSNQANNSFSFNYFAPLFPDVSLSSVSISPTSFEPPCENHFILPVSISFGSSILSTTAMIDCGATSNFIDSSFVSKHFIPIKTKSIPIPLNVIDGEPISSGPILSHTIPLSLSISFDSFSHSEILPLNVIAMSFPIVLGIPWLRSHDPEILWSTNSIRFRSASCLKNCLSSISSISSLSLSLISLSSKNYSISSTIHQTPKKQSFHHQNFRPANSFSFPHENWLNISSSSFSSISNSISFVSAKAYSKIVDSEENILQGYVLCSVVDESKGTQISNISREYSRFRQLFDKSAADVLPGHQPWDHTIPLEPGKTPPYGPIYSLSEQELSDLRKYLDENLAK